MRPGVKGTVTFWPAFFAACSMPAQPAKDDQVSERDLLAAGGGAVECALDTLQGLEDFRQLSRLIDPPILLRCQTDAGTVCTAALVGAAERGRRSPGGCYQFRHRQARSQDLALEGGDVLFIGQLVIDGRNGVLPDELLPGDLRAEIACTRTHVAVCKFEPGASERVC